MYNMRNFGSLIIDVAFEKNICALKLKLCYKFNIFFFSLHVVEFNLDMTDLNSDPIDIGSEAYNDPSVLYVGSSIPHHMTTGAGNVGIAVSSFAAP